MKDAGTQYHPGRLPSDCLGPNVPFALVIGTYMRVSVETRRMWFAKRTERSRIPSSLLEEALMQGADVYAVLQRIGATQLHHANTVTTSSTFLEQGGLASRGFVERHSLRQTPQSSDEKDKRYNIWHCVFLDHVDIHYRAGRAKGPNLYGPVLFLLDLGILLRLPVDSEVFVTKTNPVHWFDSQPVGDRWFQSTDELAANLVFGNFDKMLVIQTPSAMIPFPDKRVQIALDDPKRRLTCGEDAYAHANESLQVAAVTGGIGASISPHECRSGCTCVEEYARYTPAHMDLSFT